MVLKTYFLRCFKTLFFHREPEGPGLKPYFFIGKLTSQKITEIWQSPMFDSVALLIRVVRSSRIFVCLMQSAALRCFRARANSLVNLLVVVTWSAVGSGADKFQYWKIIYADWYPNIDLAHFLFLNHSADAKTMFGKEFA